MLNNPHRRAWIQAGLAMAALPAAAWSQTVSAGRSTLRMVQLLDMSPQQQELSRDYSTGVRLAWATEWRQAKGLAKVSLETVNTDGSEASVAAALAKLSEDSSAIALIGTVGDRLSVLVQNELGRRRLKIAQIAPWMADSRHEAELGVNCLFASRSNQLQQALTAMRGMGANDLCVIYGSTEEQTLYDPQVAAIAQAQKLRLSRLTGDIYTSATTLAGRIPATSTMVLCLATSAELALLTQAMSARKDRRFVLALGDVDSPSLMQLAPGKGVPVILTQVVPNPMRSKLAVVAAYRARLEQLFEEAPSTISLAGYIAGLYAAALAREVGVGLGREAMLAQAGKRTPQDIGGWRVDFREDHRGSRFVNHTLLSPSGEIVG
jgi:hypothetical protein